MPGLAMHHNPRSLSPVSSMSGEELTAAVRRSRRRQGFLDKQVSCESSSQQIDGQDQIGGGEKGLYSEEQTALDRVRFDDNVSFIEANSPDTEMDKLRALKKSDLESSTLREETAEELALVVSPLPKRPTPSLNVEHVPSIEVVSPWSLPEDSLGSSWVDQSLSPSCDSSDKMPLLNISTPTSDTEEGCHNISNITVMTDATEASNVTSISIEHSSCTFNHLEHDNKAMIPNDNISYVSLEGSKKAEGVKIKIGVNDQDVTESICESL